MVITPKETQKEHLVFTYQLSSKILINAGVCLDSNKVWRAITSTISTSGGEEGSGG